ncbi:hypothetical protein B0H13DRAFT_2310427 [Mycena leptocephala]|nr:hypothetical protein B0H13DRAFT_2310427 [Mycena leptocephala]
MPGQHSAPHINNVPRTIFIGAELTTRGRGVVRLVYGAVVYLMGGWFIGGCLDFVLQGIIFCQLSNYMRWYPDDKWHMKSLVAGLALLTTLKTIQAFVIVWFQNILFFTDVEGALNLNYAWWEYGNLPMLATVGLYVQAYYVYRLYVLSAGKIYVTVPICALLLAAYVCAIAGLGTRDKAPNAIKWFKAHLALIFAGDFLITALSGFFLLKTRQKSLLQRLISSLMRLAIQAAAPAALTTLVMEIASELGPPDLSPAPVAAINLALLMLYRRSVYIALSFSLLMRLAPDLRSSMMYTLNSRNSIRMTASSGVNSSGGQPSRSRKPVTDNHELGILSGIHVHTAIETNHDPRSITFHNDSKGVTTIRDDESGSIGVASDHKMGKHIV